MPKYLTADPPPTRTATPAPSAPSEVRLTADPSPDDEGATDPIGAPPSRDVPADFESAGITFADDEDVPMRAEPSWSRAERAAPVRVATEYPPPRRKKRQVPPNVATFVATMAAGTALATGIIAGAVFVTQFVVIPVMQAAQERSDAREPSPVPGQGVP